MAQDSVVKTDIVKTALMTKINGDITELFVSQSELIAGRDGESSLLAKQNAQDASIAALATGSGVVVSSNDATVGYLNGKLVAGEGMDLTEGSDGGDEILTVSGEDATVSNKGIASFPTAQFTVSSGAVTIKNATTAVKGVASFASTDFDVSSGAISLKSAVTQVTEFIPIEWAEDGTSAPDTTTLFTHTNGKVRLRKFAGDSSKDVIIPWRVPTNIKVADGIKFEVCCVVTEATGPSNEGVSFKMSGYSSGDGDDITGAFGTEVESKKTGVTYAQYVTFDTVLSEKVTVTNLAAGEMAMLKLYRDHDDTDDDYVQKLGVYGVVITYERV